MDNKKIKVAKYTDYLIDFSLLFTIVGFLQGNSFIFIIASCLILIHNFLFSLEDLSKRIIFASFNFTFAFFLLSRFFVTAFFGVDYEYGGIYDMGFSLEVTKQIIVLINISLLSLSITYISIKKKDRLTSSIFLYFIWYLNSRISKSISKLNSKHKLKKRKLNFEFFRNSAFIRKVKWISFIFFIITVLIRIYLLYEEMEYIRLIGYRASYLEDIKKTGLMRILDIISRMEFSSFLIYLSTKPKIKYAIIPSILFIIPGILTLSIGARADFILNTMIVVIYFIMSTKNQLNLRRFVIGIILSIPVFLFIFIFIDIARGTSIDSSRSISIIDRILRLFYDQGVSARVIGNAISIKEDIPNKVYSLGDVSDFIKYGIVGRLKGVSEPTGQSLEVVLGKNQLSHTISYLQSPFEYLNYGLGLGSSYIAELFIDFNYYGLIIGSVFYGYIIDKFEKWFKSGNIVLVFLSLIFTRNLLFTPRAGFSYILFTFLNEAQLAVVFLTFSLALIVYLVARKRDSFEKNINLRDDK